MATNAATTLEEAADTPFWQALRWRVHDPEEALSNRNAWVMKQRWPRALLPRPAPRSKPRAAMFSERGLFFARAASHPVFAL